MPRLELANHVLNYRIDGEMTDNPWLVFCNSLGTDLHMWDRQAEALSDDFRILRYDRRGHGLSTAPSPPFTLADLGQDVIALLDALAIQRTHFCGLSIGGLVGQWLAINAGQRLDKVVVCATAAKIGTAESWNARISAVRKEGTEGLVTATADRWFSPGFRANEPAVVQRILEGLAATSIGGYAGCCSALAAADLHDEIGQIANSLLAVSGDDDPVCPPPDLDAIANSVKNGHHVSLPGRHMINVESAATLNQLMRSFLI